MHRKLVLVGRNDEEHFSDWLVFNCICGPCLSLLKPRGRSAFGRIHCAYLVLSDAVAASRNSCRWSGGSGTISSLQQDLVRGGALPTECAQATVLLEPPIDPQISQAQEKCSSLLRALICLFSPSPLLSAPVSLMPCYVLEPLVRVKGYERVICTPLIQPSG